MPEEDEEEKKKRPKEGEPRRGHVFIAGGTAGVGAGLAEAMREQGYEVIDAGPEAPAWHLDLGEAATIKACTNRAKALLRGKPLDMLVLNAAVWPSSHRVTYDGDEATFAVNHFGQAYLLDLMLPCLKRSADPRVVIVSALDAYGGVPQATARDWQMQLRQDPPFLDYPVLSMPAMYNRYADSKLCGVLFAQTLSKMHPWLSVTLAHPGPTFSTLIGGVTYHFVVEFFARVLFKSPTGAAQTPLFCLLSDRKNLRSDVIYSEMSAMPLPWQVTPAACKALWEATEAEIGSMHKRASLQVGDQREW